MPGRVDVGMTADFAVTTVVRGYNGYIEIPPVNEHTLGKDCMYETAPNWEVH